MRSTLCLVTAACFISGCSENNAPPPPLPVEQLPAALDKAFGQAQAGPKDLAAEIAAAVRAADYPKAFIGFQSLAGAQNLTKEQNSVLTRGMLTVNALLQTAQAQGDAKATAALKDFRRSK